MTLPGIQIVRAIAATMVVIFHIGRLLLLKGGVDITPFTSWCIWGVDLFFVVSGFIMVYTTYGKPFDARAFLRRRLTRIAPLYWLCTIALLAMMLVAGRPIEWPNTLAAFAFLPSYNAQGTIYPPLAQGWTLVYEMFFYVCFAIASQLWFRKRLRMLLAIFGALVICGTLPPVHNATWTTYTSPMLLEFLLGGLLGEMAAREMLPKVPIDFSRWRLALAIGDSSYSLYLTHTFVISAFGAVGMATLQAAPFILLVSLFAGWLCWRYVERPLTKALATPLQPKGISHAK